MLSRVQSLDQVFILNKLDPRKIKVSGAGLTELKRLEDISFNRNPSLWIRKPETSINVAALNCAGLRAHFPDIRADSKMLYGDIVHLVETSLTPSSDDEDSHFGLSGYQTVFNSVGNGKGQVTYHKLNSPSVQLVCIKKPYFQITKLETDKVSI